VATMSTDFNSDRLWRIEELAEYLSVPVGSVYKLTAPKARIRLPHIRIAGRLRFRKREVDAWLELYSTSDNHVIRRIRTAAQGGRNGDDPQAPPR
jgi:excisionase family DNA binding protein